MAFDGSVGFFCRELQVGEANHTGALVSQLKDESINILGLYCLNRYNPTFDFPHRKLYLDHSKLFDTPRHDFNDGVNMERLELDGQEGIALEVFRGSKAKEIGLKTEDMLLGLNGNDVQKLHVAAIRRQWSQRGAKDLKVRVRRNGFDDDPTNDLELEFTFDGKIAGREVPK